MTNILAQTDRIGTVIKTIAVLMVIYTVSVTYWNFNTGTEYVNIHLLFVLVLVGLEFLRKYPKLWPLWVVFIAIAVASCLYVHFSIEGLQYRSGYPTIPDMYAGVALIFLALIACYWAFGGIIAGLVIVALLYALFGYLIPGFFNAFKPELPRLVSALSIGLSGVYGPLLTASASYIFLFIVLGAVIQLTPATLAFTEMSRFVAARSRGGVGHMPIVSSSIIGMVTGASAANIAITGAVTIPAMKKAGYDAETAGSLEAVASQGGQIMPPILGASAFVMAELTGIDYFQICIATLLPAVLFFLSLAINVELRGRRMNLPVERIKVNYRDLFIGLPYLVIPIGLLVTLMGMQYTPNYAAFWTLLVTFAMTFVAPKTRPTLRQTVNGLTDGVLTGIRISGVTAGLGMVLTVMTSTGLAIKLPEFVEVISAGNVWIAMFFTFLLCIILGCGLPTLALYLIVALITAPLLVSMGMSPLAAHLAIFYFGVFQGITPPFAPGAMIASQIAGGKWWPTALKSMVIGSPALFLPFLWVINPVLIGDFADPVRDFFTITATLAAILAMNALSTGYFVRRLKGIQWVMMLITMLIFAYSVIVEGYTYFWPAAALLIALTAWQYLQGKQTGRVEQQAST